MDSSSRCASRGQEGQRWHDAVALAGLPLHRSAAYHLVKRVRTEGEEAYIDHRHVVKSTKSEQVLGVLLTFGGSILVEG